MIDASTLVQGVVAGCIYALAGISLNILYRPTNTFNFAQGELIMIGGILCATLVGSMAVPWYAAALVAIVAVAALATVVDLVAVAPLLRRPGHGAGWIISTLAVGLILQDALGKLVGADPLALPPPPPLSTEMMDVGQLQVSTYQIGVIVLTALLVLGTEIFYRSRTGKAILAIAEDRDASRLLAIDPVRLARLSFLVGGALAALAGIMAAPMLYASISIGPLLLIKGFEAVAVGGVGSNRGAILAGLGIGLTEAVAAVLVSPGYQTAISFAVVLAVLLVKPYGLFGHAQTRAV